MHRPGHTDVQGHYSPLAIVRFRWTPNSDMVDKASERARWRQALGCCIWLTLKSEVYLCNHCDAAFGPESSHSAKHIMAKKPRKTMPFPAFCNLLGTSFFLLAGVCFPTSTTPRHLRRARAQTALGFFSILAVMARL